MGVRCRGMRNDKPDLNEELRVLDETAVNIVKDLIRGNYNYASMLFFSSKIQWLVFNAELVRRDMGLEDKRRDEILHEFKNKLIKKYEKIAEM